MITLYVGTRECATSNGYDPKTTITPPRSDGLHGKKGPIAIVVCRHCYRRLLALEVDRAIGIAEHINRRDGIRRVTTTKGPHHTGVVIAEKPGGRLTVAWDDGLTSGISDQHTETRS